MIRELTLWSCSGFLISIPFTPNLLKAVQFKKSHHHFQQNSRTQKDPQKKIIFYLFIKKDTCYVFVKRSLKSQNPDSHCNQVKKKKKKEKGLAMEIGERKKEGEPLWSTIPRCKELLSKKKKKEKERKKNLNLWNCAPQREKWNRTPHLIVKQFPGDLAATNWKLW